MLRRHLNSDFVGGAYVFPGGRSTRPTGRSGPRPAVWAGPTPTPRPCSGSGRGASPSGWRPCANASRRPGSCWPIPRGRPRVTPWSTSPTPRSAAGWPAAGTRSTPGPSISSRPAGPRGSRLAVDRVHYFSHWITPEPAPKRYDTRFFVTALPPGQVPIHDDHETTDTVWVQPGEALERARAGSSTSSSPPSRTWRPSPVSTPAPSSWRGGRRRTGPHRPAPGGGRRAGIPDPAPRRPRLRGGGGATAPPAEPRAPTWVTSSGPSGRRAGRRTSS